MSNLTADCPRCTRETQEVSRLGALNHFQCQNCGWWFSTDAEKDEDMDKLGVKIDEKAAEAAKQTKKCPHCGQTLTSDAPPQCPSHGTEPFEAMREKCACGATYVGTGECVVCGD